MSDTVSIDGMPYRQNKGLAMGNNASPPLAIIYMNKLEKELLPKMPEVILWKRYIDDVFVVFKDMANYDLLTKANNVNPAIQFTLETSEDHHLPFLDLLIYRNGNRIETRLYSIHQTMPLRSYPAVQFLSSQEDIGKRSFRRIPESETSQLQRPISA